jgi:hypothetical protein
LGAALKNCQLFHTLYATYSGAAIAKIIPIEITPAIKLVMIRILFVFYFACVSFFIANRLRRITAAQFLNAFYFISK